MDITFKNSQQAFEHMYDYIMTNGKDKDGTKYIKNVNMTILNPDDNLIHTPWRKWSLSYADLEYRWYLSGNRSVSEIGKHAKIWNQIADENGEVNSNYGYQWKRNNQLMYAMNELKRNENSRRSCITIYDAKEWQSFKKDTPCTLNICFDVDDNKLNMTVMMRSNDLVYGFCNDQYCFSSMQSFVADYLKLPMGTYTHYVLDLHIYERHYKMKK